MDHSLHNTRCKKNKIHFTGANLGIPADQAPRNNNEIPHENLNKSEVYVPIDLHNAPPGPFVKLLSAYKITSVILADRRHMNGLCRRASYVKRNYVGGITDTRFECFFKSALCWILQSLILNIYIIVGVVNSKAWIVILQLLWLFRLEIYP